MTVNWCMCLTIKCEKTLVEKNCRKSHSRKLGNQRIAQVEKTLGVLGKLSKPKLHYVHYLTVVV